MSAIVASPRLPSLPNLRAVLLLTALLGTALLLPPAPSGTGAANSGAPSEGRVVEGYGELPISFEPNVGQAPQGYDFLARGQGFGVAIDAAGVSLALGAETGEDLLRLELLGARRSATPQTLDPLAGTVNFVVGEDALGWRTDVATFGRVSYDGVLPGIDVSYFGTNGGTLEYDFVVAPNADPADIRIGITGAKGVAIEAGRLVVTTAGGALTQEAPVVFQEVGGERVPVPGAFSLDDGEVGFTVGAYDHTLPLVIDPVLTYSSYLGGSGDDVAWSVAVDGSGAAYLAGSTTSANFPTTGALQGGFAGGGGGGDAFVTKLDPAGSPVYSTYLGGSDEDVAHGIAVDGSGAAYVTGFTFSADFPTQSAFQGANAGGNDAFLTKLSPAGSALTYSTYLGGQLDDLAKAVAVDGSGAAYLTGNTNSADFPTQSPLQAAYAGGLNDAFLTKFDAAGSALAYSTYLGGSADDYAWGVAVDGAGAAYLAGDTFSTNFPVAAAFQSTHAGDSDAFVSKLDAAGTTLVYSTYLGGSGADSAEGGIAIDGSGAAYVAGSTLSPDLPTQSPLQASAAGGMDAFVTKLDAAGSALAYSTYLGGSAGDAASAIAVDGSGAVYLAGATSSTDFPVLAPAQGTNAGSDDGFVATLGAAGSALGYSTYLGGSSFDHPHGMALDGSAAAYVVGATSSTSFPTQSAFQASSGGGLSDAFVTKLSGSPTATCGGQAVTIQVTAPNLTTYGTGGPDVIRGTSGPDTVYGLGGNDVVCGLGGDDLLFGGSGGDNLYGQGGHDRLVGNGGGDNLFGGAGRDRLTGSAGNDALFGGSGSDVLRGLVGNDFGRGGLGPDVIEGGSGADRLLGEAGNDLIRGGLGSDVLKGGTGADRLFGEAGKDALSGGPHFDSCNGGPPATGDSAVGCEVVSFVP